MDRERFDALTRVLGADASRRGALGALAGLIGLGLGELLPASAKRKDKQRQSARRKQDRSGVPAKGGNSACAHFCKAIFTPGPERGHCVSDAAHGEGLCPECEADPTRACPQPDGSIVCCAANRPCNGATGACGCTDTSPCGDSKTRNPDTCACECRADLPACTGVKTRDPETCECECPPPACTGVRTRNPETCACECPPAPSPLACINTPGCSPVTTSDGCQLCGTAQTCDPCPSGGCPGADAICVLGCANPNPPFPVCARLCPGF